MLRNLVFAVPVFGWMLKSAWHGDTTEKVSFVGNLVAIWAFAMYFFGYPAFIVPALTIVALYLIGLVYMTASDLLA